MLQRNMQSIDETHAPLSTGPVETEGFGEMMHRAVAFLRRRYLIITLIATLAMTACITYLRITPPTYTARVQIVLNNSRAEFLQQQSLSPDPIVDASLIATKIATQLELLKSRAIAVKVIGDLKLANDPDFKDLGSSVSWFGRSTPSLNDPTPAVAGQPSERLIAAFENRLTATRASSSNVIEVSFSSSSPVQAAEVANAVANAYIADQVDVKVETNRSAKDWLQDKLHELAEQALAADREVSVYKSQNNIVTSDGKPIDELQITELNSRLAAARVQTSEAAARANRYKEILHASSGSSFTLGTLDAGPDSLTSPIINNLRQQYMELARHANEWAAKFGANHQAVLLLRGKMAEIRTSILEEVKRLAEASVSELDVAKQRQQEIEKQLSDVVSQSRSTRSAELTIRALESRAKESRSLYDSLLHRYMGSLDNFPMAEARVIAPALPPQTKSKPKTALVLAIGALGGLALGVGLGLLKDLMDRVFRTSAQIESELELPCLSIVPRLTGRKSQLAAASRRADNASRLIASPPSAVHDVAVNMPSSRYAEALRSIKLAIDLSPGKASNQVIGLTSALPNEGKTTIASSLAQLIGHTGKKVIIVDCDLRNPSLTACFAPNAENGLIEVINGNRSLEDTVWRDPKTGLVFLPAVLRKPLFHSSEILSAEATSTLFNQLRAAYDYVIVDLPPLTPLVDVRVTSSMIDFFILVVEWGRTKIGVAQHALHTAPNVYENLIGVVLNKTDIKSMLRYDAQHSDYYSDSHYIRYGLSDSG